MDNLKLVKKAYNNHDKKGITLINIVVLLFCILIVYGFNILNIVSKDSLNIRRKDKKRDNRKGKYISRFKYYI